jgi:hypothetical protein
MPSALDIPYCNAYLAMYKDYCDEKIMVFYICIVNRSLNIMLIDFMTIDKNYYENLVNYNFQIIHVIKLYRSSSTTLRTGKTQLNP